MKEIKQAINCEKLCTAIHGAIAGLNHPFSTTEMAVAFGAVMSSFCVNLKEDHTHIRIEDIIDHARMCFSKTLERHTKELLAVRMKEKGIV